MNKIIKKALIFYTFLMFVLSTSISFSKEFIGVTEAAIGEIKNQNQEILITGSKVFYGDTILTSKASNAQILFLDQTVLTLGEDTELTIDDFIYNSETHDGNFVTEVKSGTVKFITGQISKLNPDNLEVKLPEGTLGARGTEFVVLSEKNKKSTIVLLGPGPNNSLGMIPGSLQISDGNNMVSITNPGYQAMIEN